MPTLAAVIANAIDRDAVQAVLGHEHDRPAGAFDVGRRRFGTLRLSRHRRSCAQEALPR